MICWTEHLTLSKQGLILQPLFVWTTHIRMCIETDEAGGRTGCWESSSPFHRPLNSAHACTNTAAGTVQLHSLLHPQDRSSQHQQTFLVQRNHLGVSLSLFWVLWHTKSKHWDFHLICIKPEPSWYKHAQKIREFIVPPKEDNGENVCFCLWFIPFIPSLFTLNWH